MTRRNRGRTNRRIRAPARTGLGTRRVQRNMVAPLELRSMGSTETRGSQDPESVKDTVKVRHRVQLPLTVTSSGSAVTATSIAAVIPASGTAWPQFRILKIDVWGPDSTSTAAPFASPIALQMVGGDGASFSDWGTQGQQRAQLHIIPDFEFRSIWRLATGTTALFTVFSNDTTGVSIIVNVTLEMRTATQALPNFLLTPSPSVPPCAEICARSGSR
jgi:hypothetical protein